MTVDPVAVAVRMTRLLDGLGIAHTVGESLASSVAGEPRSTVDIHIVAAIEDRHVDGSSRAWKLSSMSLSRALREE